MGIPGESKVLDGGISKYHDPLPSKNTRILLLFKGSEPQGLSKGHSAQKQGRRLSSFWNKVAAGIIFSNREKEEAGGEFPQGKQNYITSQKWHQRQFLHNEKSALTEHYKKSAFQVLISIPTSQFHFIEYLWVSYI